jgi:hypothetical protein
MAAGGHDRMPPLATSVPDSSGLDVVGRWIDAIR